MIQSRWDVLASQGGQCKQPEQVGAVTAPNQYVNKDDAGWHASMMKELDSLKSFGVYTKVPRSQVPPGVKVLGTRWVHTLKDYGHASYVPTDAVAESVATKKSRFVVQGWGVQAQETYACTPMLQSLKTVLVVAALYTSAPASPSATNI